MSGPKTSAYTVTSEVRRKLLEQAKLEQQRQLEEQQRIERENKKAEEQKKIKNLLVEIAALPDSLEEACNIAEIQQKTYGIGKQFLNKVSLLKEDIKSEIKENSNQDLTLEQLLEVKQQLYVAKKAFASRIASMQKEGLSIHKELSDNLEKDIENGFKINIPRYNEHFVVQADQAQKQSIDFSSEISDVKDELLALTTKCSKTLKEEIIKAITSLEEITEYDFFQNFKSITVHRIKKEYEIEQRQIQQKFLEAQLYQKEQSYISDTIDEVMEEMGYTIIGNREVTKKSGKRFRDELYTFSEGTAVNIRYDSQGKIAMELGGIDSTDRLPSSLEALKLENEMVMFCDKFTELEKRLETKGIVCKNRISHLPPKAEYAQIINTSDYDMETEPEIFKAECRNIKGNRKKQHRNE